MQRLGSRRLPKSRPSQKMFEWVEFLILIHLERLINYSYSFRKQLVARFFKIKTVTTLITETCPILPTNLLKKNLTYSSIFNFYFKKIFAAAKASLVFIKSKCRTSRSQIFFKIGVLKNFAVFAEKQLCWILFLIELQAFRCFPVNISKFVRATFL